MPGGIERLQKAGVPTSNLSEGAQAALDDLSPEEVDVMVSIRARLQAAGVDDVEGFARADNGVFNY